MPRSPIVYSPPPGTVPQQPLTPIPSAAWNGFVNDVTNTLNLPQPVEYGGTAGTTAISGHDGLTTKGANVATAATLNLDSATGAFVDLTGTTTVTAVTLSDGRHRMARATSAFQITVGASLIGNAGGSNINVEVGDLIIFEGYSAGVVRFWVIRASGLPVVSSVALPRQYISQMPLANNATDANNDIDIPAGDARDDANAVNITLASAITKRLDAVWAAGTNNGGLDTGTKSVSTWYYLWLIRNPTTLVVDVLMSLSATAPTMPSGYTQKRRLPGAIRTDASGNIRAFSMIERSVFFNAPVEDYTSAAGRALALLSLTAPTQINTKVLTQLTVNHISTVASVTYQFGPGNVSSPPTITLGTQNSANGVFGAIGPSDFLAVAGQIYMGGGSVTVTTRVFTYGFEDVLA